MIRVNGPRDETLVEIFLFNALTNELNTWKNIDIAYLGIYFRSSLSSFTKSLRDIEGYTESYRVEKKEKKPQTVNK